MKKIAFIIGLITLFISINGSLYSKNLNNNRLKFNTLTDTLKTEQKKVEPKKSNKNIEVVIFSTNMHCESCVNKISENLSYMKGIKKLDISLENQEIKITYDSRKTNAQTFEKEIIKLGYKAEQIKK